METGVPCPCFNLLGRFMYRFPRVSSSTILVGLLSVMCMVGCAHRTPSSENVTMRAMQVVVPQAIKLWSDFDDRRGERQHGAIDIKADKGVRILAASGGVVQGTGKHVTAGKWLDLRHKDGVVSRYLHLSRIQARKGDVVRSGQCIGRVGDTGNAKKPGPHLHFEWVVHGKKRDPLPELIRIYRMNKKKR